MLIDVLNQLSVIGPVLFFYLCAASIIQAVKFIDMWHIIILSSFLVLWSFLNLIHKTGSLQNCNKTICSIGGMSMPWWLQLQIIRTSGMLTNVLSLQYSEYEDTIVFH